jgi:hypothetical protein
MPLYLPWRSQRRAGVPMSDKILSNPIAVRHLATRLRQRLAQGYPEGSRFLIILSGLDDTAIVKRYLSHEKPLARVHRKPNDILSLRDGLRTLLNGQED